jgi:fatty-acyl-CoA synthase
MDNEILRPWTLGQILDRTVAAYPDNEAVVKDMIIRGGENIYPREIEEYLFKLEGIADVQVVGVPHRKYGEEVGAFIKLKLGVSVTEEDVKDFCRGRISRYKIPRHVAFVDTYPMTASGKIQKYKLVELSKTMFAEEGKKA